jgi:hypothetical protein
MSPLAWFGLLYVAWRLYKTAIKEGDERYRVLFWLGVPPLAFFYFIGLWSKTSEPHWSAFGYLTGFIAWAAYYTYDKQSWKKYTIASLAVGGAMILMVYVHTLKPFLPLKPKYDITNLLYGWDVVGEAVEKDLQDFPGEEKDKFIMAHHWVMCSQIDFATKHRHDVYCVNGKTDQFDFFPKTVPPTGANFIFVADDRFEEPPDAFYLFDKFEKAQKITIFRGGGPAREFQLYRVYGYKGQK